MTPEQTQELEKLRKDLNDLIEEVYKNNFSAFQEFNKKSSFTGGLKIPHYDVIPLVGERGEVIEVDGKAYICSSTNIFTLIGSQT